MDDAYLSSFGGGRFGFFVNTSFSNSVPAPKGLVRVLYSMFWLPLVWMVFMVGPAEAAELYSNQLKVAGLTFTAPREWKRVEPKTSMRKGQWQAAKGVDVVVFYFGRGQGGDVPANLDRWRSSMKSPTGEAMVGEVQERQLGKVPATELQLYGTYSNSMGFAGVPPKPKANYGLVGVILETPQGNVFVRMTGPEAAVKSNLPKFQKFIDSVAPKAKPKKKKKRRR